MDLLLACRLLRHDVGEAQRIIGPAVAPLSSFAEEQSPEIMDRIFSEFNSLSVIYRRPSQAFVKVCPPPNLTCLAQTNELVSLLASPYWLGTFFTLHAEG